MLGEPSVEVIRVVDDGPANGDVDWATAAQPQLVESALLRAAVTRGWAGLELGPAGLLRYGGHFLCLLSHPVEGPEPPRNCSRRDDRLAHPLGGVILHVGQCQFCGRCALCPICDLRGAARRRAELIRRWVVARFSLESRLGPFSQRRCLSFFRAAAAPLAKVLQSWLRPGAVAVASAVCRGCVPCFRCRLQVAACAIRPRSVPPPHRQRRRLGAACLYDQRFQRVVLRVLSARQKAEIRA